MLQLFTETIDILEDNILDGIVSLQIAGCQTRCVLSEKFRLKNFFFFDSCLITSVHIKFLLDDFIMEVLQILSVAPT